MQLPTVRALGTAGAATIGIAFMSLAIAMGKGRDAIAAAVVVLLGGVAARAPRLAIGVTLVYLALLGDIRRVLIGLVGWQARDPLLLVGPIMALLLAVPALLSREQHRSRLQLLVNLLLALMVLQVFNPRQGGAAVGLAGALFYVVPLLWFFVGRAYGDQNTLRAVLLRVVPTVALAAAALGIYQAFFGWLPFEKRWLVASGYAALHLGSRLRPISFFTSSAEYEYFIGVAAVVAASLALKRRRGWLVLIVPLAAAGFLAGSRAMVVASVFTVAVLWASLGRQRAVWLPRLLIALLLAAGGGYWTLKQLNTIQTGPVAGFVQHQTQGLLHPLNKRVSTATTHVDMVANGIVDGLHTPLGRGLGITTLAASSFGAAGFSTELDVTNVLISLGIAGGLVYLAIIVSVLLKSFRFWRVSRLPMALALMGALIMTIGSWLNGGQYALSALIWFAIGSLDRLSQERHT